MQPRSYTHPEIRICVPFPHSLSNLERVRGRGRGRREGRTCMGTLRARGGMSYVRCNVRCSWGCHGVTYCPKQHFFCPETSSFHNTSGFHGVPECLRTVGPIPAYPTAAFAAAASHQSAITYHNVLSLLSPASPTTATIDSQLLAANLSDAATRVPPPP